MKKVFIEAPDRQYINMFTNRNWEVVKDPAESDFILFTGGEDVDPTYYDEPKHPLTGSNPNRDAHCMKIFQEFKGKKNFLGICRGSQFLTVASGGSLWQHVVGHGGNHPVVDLATGRLIEVSSTHHQMMDSSKIEGRQLLAVATKFQTRKQRGNDREHFYTDYDEEANYYPSTRSMVFQPHPEYFSQDQGCNKYYFELIDRVFQ